MNYVERTVMLRIRKLEELIVSKTRCIDSAPKGRLRISKTGNSCRYYHIRDRSDPVGEYVRQGQADLIMSLMQKGYDEKVISAAKKEMEYLKKILDRYPETTVEQVYDTLSDERRQMVTPIIKPLDIFIEEWQNVQYEGGEFRANDPVYFTNRGEKVRSKSEKIIADAMERLKIPYRYEYPLVLNDGTIVNPDFDVLNVCTRKEYRMEHLGMMDDIGYVSKNLRKMREYEKNGFYAGENIIYLWETSKEPLDTCGLDDKLRHYFLSN